MQQASIATVDVALLGVQEERLQVLLVQRSKKPAKGRWSTANFDRHPMLLSTRIPVAVIISLPWAVKSEFGACRTRRFGND